MPTSLEAVTEVHARRQKLLAQRAAKKALALWRKIDQNNIAATWRLLAPDVVALVAVAQATSAAGAGIYIEDCLEALSLDASAEGRTVAAAFSGYASDGRDLASLVYRPAVTSLLAIQQGVPATRALASGSLALDVIARTQVADAGRAAESVSIASRPAVQGYVRMLSQPSCSRCIILAGRFYRWSSGFRRHPRCDCRHIPSQENTAGDLTTDPKKLFQSMPVEERERVFGKAGTAAIEDGADMARVVNADRGTYLAGNRKLTTEAAGGRIRLTPDQIYREAKGSREEAIRLLRRFGYIS